MRNRTVAENSANKDLNTPLQEGLIISDAEDGKSFKEKKESNRPEKPKAVHSQII